MCNPTKQPPRRDMYQLETEIGTRKVPSFLPKTKPGRIGTPEWHKTRPGFTAIYNANFTRAGRKYGDYPDPWTLIGPDVYKSFETHAEALAYAFKETT